MSKELDLAVDGLKVFLSKFKNIHLLAEALESIKSVDQAANEANARKDVAVKEELAAVEAKKLAEAKLVHIETKIDSAKEEANLILEAAKKNAHEVYDTFKAQGESLVIEALQKKQMLLNEIEKLKLECAKHSSEVNAVKAELIEVSAKVKAVKDQMAAFLK